MQTALGSGLRSPAFGGSIVGEVVDAATGDVLFDRDATTSLPPASTAKLLTAAAALTTLGPTATLSTKVVRAGDTVYLVGGGDVTLRARARPAYPPVADIATLATRTVAALRAAPTGATPSSATPGPLRLCADTSAWDGPARAPGWSQSYFNDGDIAPLSALEVDEGVATIGQNARVADPAGAAAAAFAEDVAADGVRLRTNGCRAVAPATATVVASVSSPPVAALVQRMLTVSDNDLAEALGRTVAGHEGASRDFSGEAAAVASALTRLGVPTTSLRLVDASGLSRLDRVPPTLLIDVLRLAISPTHPELRPLLDGLPIAGLTGTLADRYRRRDVSAAAGLARAKTGTLLGVNTIAGYVVDTDGRLLVFAFLTGHAVSPDTAEPALDRLVAALAGV